MSDEPHELRVVRNGPSATPPVTIGRLIARTAMVADSASYRLADRERNEAGPPEAAGSTPLGRGSGSVPDRAWSRPWLRPV